ncbi:MAG: sigma-70 family RNA polymerase sigma factor [Planctomycetales bacterium]|nr:sigma-70 family RNA polymerase sigma factor [Planctomycetales bacterium]
MDDWAELIDQYGPLVYRCAWRILRHRQECEDVVQDVFTSAWTDPNLAQIDNLGGWLTRIATRRAIDRLRKREPLLSSDLHQSAIDWECGLEASELSESVRREVASLPDQQGLAFSLKHFQGMTNKEIARQLDISPSAVSSALYSARQTLARVLTPLFSGEKQ